MPLTRLLFPETIFPSSLTIYQCSFTPVFYIMWNSPLGGAYCARICSYADRYYCPLGPTFLAVEKQEACAPLLTNRGAQISGFLCSLGTPFPERHVLMFYSETWMAMENNLLCQFAELTFDSLRNDLLAIGIEGIWNDCACACNLSAHGAETGGTQVQVQLRLQLELCSWVMGRNHESWWRTLLIPAPGKQEQVISGSLRPAGSTQQIPGQPWLYGVTMLVSNQHTSKQINNRKKQQTIKESCDL